MSTKRSRWLSTRYHLLLIGSAILVSILYKIFPSVFALFVKSFPIAICTVLLLGMLLIYRESNISRAKEEGGRDVGNHITIKNQDKVSNAVNRRKNSGEVEVKGSKFVMALAEMNNVTHQLGASSEPSSCLLNETTDICHATADENESVGSNADPDRHTCEYILSSTNSVSPCHDHGHRCHASVESEQNGQESSKASEADVMSLLDELDPLLDPEANQAVLATNNNSDACSRDRESNDDSMAEEAGIQDDEEDDETHEDKEDENKAAVTWTEDDQSNLVHLGNSELERNRRLESLIAKRRSRKIPQYRIEKNLIDLDGLDSLPSIEEISRLNAQLSTIYAPRKNPFDLPYDADDTIPGSAPSILLQRHNSFYQTNQEGIGSSNLGPRDVLAAPSRDSLLRRHESFTIGASLFGDVDQDIFDYRFKPYFSTESEEDEKLFSELYRQLSEMSDSKVSSDTVSLDTDQEQEGEPDLKFVAESINQVNSKEVESTDDENIMNGINVGDDHVTHAGNDIFMEQAHQYAQALGPYEDETSEDLEVDYKVSDVENVKALDDSHETHADKSIYEEQTHQSAQIFGATRDETSENLEADSTVSDAENIKVLGGDHETLAENDIAVEQIHQSAQVFGSAEDGTREDPEVDSKVPNVENVKALSEGHETHADENISEKQTRQSAQVLGAAEDETSEDLEADSIVSDAENIKILGSDHESHAENDIVGERIHQSAQVFGSTEDGTSKELELNSTVSDVENVKALGGDHETRADKSISEEKTHQSAQDLGAAEDEKTSEDLGADSIVSDAENVKVLGGDHESHAENDIAGERIHQCAQVFGSTEDETSKVLELNSTVSDVENVKALGDDHETPADKSISEEQTHQSAQVLGAAEDEKTSEDLGADSIVSDAENIKVLGGDHESHAENDIAGERIHQCAQVFGSTEDETSKELELNSTVSDVENVKALGDNHETRADKSISKEKTHQSAQYLGAAEDEKTSEDLGTDSIVSDAENIKVLGGDHESHAENDIAGEQIHQCAQVFGSTEDETIKDLELNSTVSDVENVKALGDDHETRADKSISKEQTHQSAQVLGAAEDETSGDLEADSIVSDAENIKVLGGDHETLAENGIAEYETREDLEVDSIVSDDEKVKVLDGDHETFVDKGTSVEQTHQSSQVLGAAKDKTSEDLDAIAGADNFKVVDGDHEIHADKDTYVEQTDQSAQVLRAAKDKTGEDLDAVAGADNVEVLDGDHETHADKGTYVEQTHQSAQVIGAAKDTTGEDLDTIADADNVQVLDGYHDLEADSTLSNVANVKLHYGNHETHADKDMSVEQTHHSAQVIGAADDESNQKQEIDSLVSGSDNVRVLGEDHESKSPFLSESCERSETEEQPVDKGKMDHAFSQDAVDPVKEVNDESTNMNEEVEQVLPVYDSSPSATERSKSIFSTIDETLMSTDKDALAPDNSSWVNTEEYNSGDGSLPRTTDSLAVVQDSTVIEFI